MKRLNQNGFEAMTLITLLVVVVVLGALSYTFVMLHKTKPTLDNGATATAKNTSVPANINSQADLTQASQALNQSSIQINSDLNDNSLNDDLFTLL
jgi:hypothetical protein